MCSEIAIKPAKVQLDQVDLLTPDPLEFQYLAGVDEAGRGCLAGPVTAAAVILDPKNEIPGIGDSKRIAAPERSRLAVEIERKAIAWHVAEASVEEITELNILGATLLAMRRAVEGLTVLPNFVHVDGNHLPTVSCPAQAVVGGDRLIAQIGAASILAKVHRDALLVRLDARYPGYEFTRHKGYGTRVHKEALERLGPSPCHRPTFAPVQKALAMHRHQGLQ